MGISLDGQRIAPLPLISGHKIMKLVLPYPPSLNHLYATYRGNRILSVRGKEFKNEVLALCLQKRLRPVDGDVMVTFTAYRPKKQGDLDNLIKIIQDSLKGSAWHDDKQVVEIHAYRRDDKLNPRVEIEISEV